MNRLRSSTFGHAIFGLLATIVCLAACTSADSGDTALLSDIESPAESSGSATEVDGSASASGGDDRGLSDSAASETSSIDSDAFGTDALDTATASTDREAPDASAEERSADAIADSVAEGAMSDSVSDGEALASSDGGPTASSASTTAGLEAATDSSDSAATLDTSATTSDAPSAASDSLGVGPEPTRSPTQPRPQAGLLTAADIDDNLNFDHFARLVSNWQQDVGPNLAQVTLGERLVIDLVAHNGIGVGNTELTIEAGQQRHRIVTDSAGRAYLFPRWMGLDVSDGFQASTGDEAWQIVSHTIDTAARTNEPIVLESGGETTPPAKLDVALVLDVTGSMADELGYLTVEFESIVARTEADYPGVDMRFALIVYRDFGDEFVSRTFDFTSDASEMADRLAAQYAVGGGDFPEAMHTALADSSSLSWRSGTNVARVLVLNADAPPHDAHVAEAFGSARDLGERGVRIYPLAASGVDRNAEFIMRAMAATTAGRHMFLTGDSGIGGPKLEPKAECYVVTTLDDLIYRVLASELAGERVEATESQIISSVGQYHRGSCR